MGKCTHGRKPNFELAKVWCRKMGGTGCCRSVFSGLKYSKISPLKYYSLED